jgi:circadian clock protein KaiC
MAEDITGARKRDRCVTGIDALDNVLDGGIPRGNTVLVTGSVGTGKTTLSMEFLVHGALQGENCLFVSVTESCEKLMNNIIPYEFFDDKLIREGKLETKRLVIDSITSVCYRLRTQEKIREFILRLGAVLSAKGCTSLLVSEISPAEERYSLFGVEEAIADGIIFMGNLERRGDLLRTLQVVKMRGTMHSRAKYVLDLTHCGVLLVPLLKGGSVAGGA